MKYKYVTLALCILILISVAYYLFLRIGNYPTLDGKPIACTEEAKLCPDGSAVGRTGPNCEFAECPIPIYSWSFEEINATGTPKSSVTLSVGNKQYSAGEYEGNCFEIEGSSWTLVTGEETGVICYFAGAGTELGVFEENGKLVLKKGQLDEGNAETLGLRGNFETLLTIGDN